MQQTNLLSKNEVLRLLEAEMPFLREHFGVTHAALYGSFARGESRPDSDVDLLVELERPLGFEFVDLAEYLEEKLGQRVDLATFSNFERAATHPYRRLIVEHIREDLIDVSSQA
jgi:uncharacterized protein